MNMQIINYLDISAGSIVAVIGCGGKTSLIGLVSDKLRDKKVLVSATTKKFPVKGEGVMLCNTLRQCVEHEPQTGIQCFGLFNEKTGKLETLPEDILAGFMPQYDVVLLEADGSRNLPCKGWREYEPVIPNYCTHTVGLVNMEAIGKTATEDTVLRLPEFLHLTGLREGAAITEQAMTAMVCAPNGMFKNCAGGQYLLVNQVEGDECICTAQSFLRSVKEKYPGRFKRLIYGSICLDTWHEL